MIMIMIMIDSIIDRDTLSDREGDYDNTVLY